MRLFLCLLFAAAAGAAELPELQVASIGDLTLESGGVLRDAKLGYRTEGKLNAEKSNAILFPTWFTGTSEGLYTAGALGSVDTTRFFVIAVDALGNGVSSSPSNTQAFPRITIGDMVRAEHALVTEVLGLDHLYAVMGISMGGMQTFEWITAYPDFMDKALPIVGSPRLASYDILLWQAQLEAISLARAGGDEAKASELVGMISALALQSPKYHARLTPRSKSEDLIRTAKASNSMKIADREAQLHAMLALDVSRRFGGSMEKAAGAVKARVLNVVGAMDHMVTPEPAIRFAELLGAETFALESDCGHLAFSCDSEETRGIVRRFLESP